MHMTVCMYMYVNYTKTQYFKTENNKLSNDKKNNDNHSWHNCLSEKFESTLSWLLWHDFEILMDILYKRVVIVVEKLLIRTFC